MECVAVLTYDLVICKDSNDCLGLFNGINTFQIQCLDDVDFFERIKIVQENLTL